MNTMHDNRRYYKKKKQTFVEHTLDERCDKNVEHNLDERYDKNVEHNKC